MHTGCPKSYEELNDIRKDSGAYSAEIEPNQPSLEFNAVRNVYTNAYRRQSSNEQDTGNQIGRPMSLSGDERKEKN